MTTICQTCGIQISEDEGNLWDHFALSHGTEVFYSTLRDSKMEDDLYDTLP